MCYHTLKAVSLSKYVLSDQGHYEFNSVEDVCTVEHWWNSTTETWFLLLFFFYHLQNISYHSFGNFPVHSRFSLARMLWVIPIVHLHNGMNSHVVNNRFLSHIQFKAIAMVSEQEGLCDDLSSNPDRCGKPVRHLHEKSVNRMFTHQPSSPNKQERTTAAHYIISNEHHKQQ